MQASLAELARPPFAKKVQSKPNVIKLTNLSRFANQFVLHPEKDFSRQSQLTMKTMIQAILTMGGNT
ncbi:hypothetical protein, partial [Streptococcus suis]|uniref:hypothetical protein n=1 Tax=Streptococcus suis TaxID=1307 RepID=UPI002FCB54BB